MDYPNVEQETSGSISPADKVTFCFIHINMWYTLNQCNKQTSADSRVVIKVVHIQLVPQHLETFIDVTWAGVLSKILIDKS